MRILPAQALYAHDRLLRVVGRRIRPSLPPALVTSLQRAQRGRAPAIRQAARLVAQILHDRPFAFANAPTALLLGLLYLRMNGIGLRISPRAVRSALRRWNAQAGDARSIESWFRQWAGTRLSGGA